ncbi:MAG: glycosyltransferase family 4 protein [Candidatus Reddybacter sp.]
MTETFIYNELKELALDNEVSVFSINRPRGVQASGANNDCKFVKSLRYLKFSSKDGINKYSTLSIFGEGAKNLVLCGYLPIMQRFRLFRYCYNEIQGKELSIRMFLDSLDIIKYVHDNGITHIHCHFAERNVMIAYAIYAATGIPYTFTMHGGDVYFYPPKNLKELASASKKLISVCEYNKQYLFTTFSIPLEKIKVISCGIDLEKFKQTSSTKENQLVILTVGRLITIKGHKFLVDACKILKDKKIQFQCWIVGHGPEYENLAKQINELNLVDYVHLLGPKDSNELIDLYNQSDVFVLPSLSEASPTVLKESLACETPVIATNINGIPEIVEHNYNGVLVDPEDSWQIAKSIIKLTDDVYRKKLISNSRERILSDFNLKKNTYKLKNIFET